MRYTILSVSGGLRFAMLACAAISVTTVLANPASASITYDITAWGPTSYPGPVAPPTGAPHSPVSEGGDGLGYPGDSVGLALYSGGSLDLIPGTYVKNINTLNWSVSYTYNGTDLSLSNDSPAGGDWPDLTFLITATRSIYFDGVLAGTISQLGHLKSTWENDYLSLDEGNTSTFFVQGYQIDVTPLGLAEADVQNFSGDTPWVQADRDVQARFVVTTAAVPESASLFVWSLLGLSVGGVMWWRRLTAAA